MKFIQFKAASTLLLVLTFFVFRTIQAQESEPEWITKLPVKKGFVYGAGVGKSANLPMASDKARMIALTDLTKNYSGKFETFASKCDTVLGADNAIRQIVTTIKLNQQATLSGVEIEDKVVGSQDGVTVVYMLLKLDVRNDIKTIQNEVDEDTKLRKEMNSSGLMKELKGL